MIGGDGIGNVDPIVAQTSRIGLRLETPADVVCEKPANVIWGKAGFGGGGVAI